MTLLDTRKLGIEFERRLLALDPQFEVNRKPDTETIYAYLNEAQRQVFNRLYNTAVLLPSGQEQSKLISSTIAQFINHRELRIVEQSSGANVHDASRYVMCELPEDYFSYIRSNSSVTTTYKSDNGTAKRVQNMFLRHEDFSRFVNEYFDEGIILRRPVVLLHTDQNTVHLNVVHDMYTTISSVELYYYRYPHDMNLFTKKPCELPYICFEELVETAVQLYLAYAKGQLDAEKEDAQKEQKRRQKDDEQ